MDDPTLAETTLVKPTLAETILIKAIYTNSSNLVNIAERIDVHDFAYKPYRIVYNVVKHLAASNTVVNGDSIMAWLQTKTPNNYRDIADMGGTSWLDELYDATYSGLVNLDEHVKTVVEQADRKLVQNATIKLQSQIESGVSYETAIDEFQQVIQSIHLRGKKEDVKSVGADMRTLMNRIARQDENVLGISIAQQFPKIDKMLRRLQPGRLSVVLASYKIGKSSLMLDIAWHVAKSLQVATLFVDSEMTFDEFRLRLLAKETGFPLEYLMSGLWVNSQEHIKLIDDGIKRIESAPLYWANINRMSKQQIISLTKLMQLRHHIRFMVYDYLKVSSDDADARLDKALAAKVDMLKEDIAKTCNINVLTAIQTGRTGNAAEGQDVYRLADNIIRLRATTEEDAEYGLCSHLLIHEVSRYTASGTRVPLDIDFATQRIREV